MLIKHKWVVETSGQKLILKSGLNLDNTYEYKT